MSHRISTFCARQASRYLIAAVIAGALVVAGCSAGSSQSAHAGKPAKVTLTFQMKDESGNTGKPERLTCEPTGAQPGATSECSALLQHKKNPFAPVAKGLACPMLLLSNRKILVTGTWFGVTVHRLVVDGRCDTSLFRSLDKIMH